MIFSDFQFAAPSPPQGALAPMHLPRLSLPQAQVPTAISQGWVTPPGCQRDCKGLAGSPGPQDTDGSFLTAEKQPLSQPLSLHGASPGGSAPPQVVSPFPTRPELTSWM